MKIAYLILAHNNPFHLQRLVRAIASPMSVCFIHQGTSGWFIRGGLAFHAEDWYGAGQMLFARKFSDATGDLVDALGQRIGTWEMEATAQREFTL